MAARGVDTMMVVGQDVAYNFTNIQRELVYGICYWYIPIDGRDQRLEYQA